jgi:hypothetical protein
MARDGLDERINRRGTLPQFFAQLTRDPNGRGRRRDVESLRVGWRAGDGERNRKGDEHRPLIRRAISDDGWREPQ